MNGKGIMQMKKQLLFCETCDKNLTEDIDDGIIIAVKRKNKIKKEKIILCCRECSDSINKELILEDYNCATYELNNGLKYLIIEDDFTKEALKRYKKIIESC